MPDYDFKQLSPHDFKQLSRDLIQARDGIILESFTTGQTWRSAVSRQNRNWHLPLNLYF